MDEENDFMVMTDNLSRNGSNCFKECCVESSVYVKVMGTFIFILVWPFIVLDIKYMPLGRPAAALMGGLLMVVFNIASQCQVYAILGDQDHLQTLFLLIGMMMMSYYYDRDGILQYVSLLVFGKNRSFKSVLWRVCALSAILSAIITNDATCLVLTPLLLNEHMKQKRSKLEYPPLLLGIATSSNIGSSSTFFGNPQNAFIAANSRGQVSLLIFFVTTLPAAILGMLVNVLLLYFCYFRVMWPKKTSDKDKLIEFSGSHSNSDAIQTSLPKPEIITSLRESHEQLTQSYEGGKPHSSSEMSKEQDILYSTSQNSIKKPQLQAADVEENFSVSFTKQNGANNSYGATMETSINMSGGASKLQRRINKRGDDVETEKSVYKDSKSNSNSFANDKMSSSKREKIFIGWLIFITLVMFGLLAVPPPPVVPVEFNLGLVPMAAGILTMLMDTILNRRYAFDVMMKVDWTMILMFMGLFIWLEGFQNTLFPIRAFQFLHRYINLNEFQGVLLFTSFVVIGSNILSNVPLVILLVDQLFNFHCGSKNCSGKLTGVLLAGISSIAGNFTLIGSVANLIVAEKARSITGYRLGFFEYLKFGIISTVTVLIVGVPIEYFAGNRVNIKN